jgi:pyrimidine operon attenuation protein/uracil phosphoribosyltransferase
MKGQKILSAQAMFLRTKRVWILSTDSACHIATGAPQKSVIRDRWRVQAPSGNFNVSAEFFGPSDRVLIVDDFLASGQTAKALQQIWDLARPG